MKTIAVDMDGVLADVLERYLELDARDFGRGKRIGELKGFQSSRHSREFTSTCAAMDFFAAPPVVNERQDVLHKLDRT